MSLTKAQCEKGFPGREHRDFYNIDGKRVTGFDCGPGAEGFWWVPEDGYSVSEKHNLFQSKDAAKAAKRKKLEKEMAEIKAELEAL